MQTKPTYPLLKSIWQIFYRSILITLIFLILFTAFYVHGKPKINLEDTRKNQPQATYLYAKNSRGSEVPIARLHGEENREWIPLNQIPTNLQNAFISLEDKRFYEHQGTDWIRTIAAAFKYQGQQGGSTITQQLIKNITGKSQTNISRKIQEILLALNLENNYSKDQILEAYLNTIPMGYGCYGVKTAADRYFDKPLSQLNLTECASLAGITKAPSEYNPIQHPKNNQTRRNQCLNNMRKYQFISDEEFQSAVLEPLKVSNSATASDSQIKTYNQVNNYFVDATISAVIKDFMAQYHLSREDATRRVYNGGLRIYTTENPDIQKKAEHIYEHRINFPAKKIKGKSIQSACTIMDYHGNIVATIGGTGKKTVNRGLNRATDAIRSPGSAIKPLSVYSPAIEKGWISYNSKLTNYAIRVNGKLWPRNFNGSYGSPNSRVTTQYAVAQSLNTTSARLAQRLTPKYSIRFLQDKFHISTLVTKGHPSDINLSAVAVGGMTHGVNTVEMCAAYCTFGNNGKWNQPRYYTRITDSEGTVLLKQKEKTEQAVSPSTAKTMNRILQTVVTQGTGRGCGVKGQRTFMKTGTTSDTKDKWCCGGTSKYCMAVWLGYDQQAAIPTPSNGQNPAAIIFATVMNSIYSNQ